MAVTTLSIGNNIIYTDQKRETVLFGAERVLVGVNSGEKEIAHNDVTGLNYERDRIDAQPIYDLRTQKRKCFFILDLETGQRGWYPGCIQIADTKENSILRAEKSENSESLGDISNLTVKIVDLEYDENQNIWYKVNSSDTIGYLRNTYITNIRYSDPY